MKDYNKSTKNNLIMTHFQFILSLAGVKSNKTSIQCSPDVKFISATIKKNLVKNNYEENQKKIPEQKKICDKENLVKKLLKNFI